jgi:hypothetical protein
MCMGPALRGGAVVGGVGALVYAAIHDPLLAYLALLLATA